MITHLKVLRNLTNETLEGELADEQLGRLLVATNFTESDGTGPEAVRLLDTTGCAGLRSCELKALVKLKCRQLTAAVLRAADLAASCLRGALPEEKMD